MGDVSEDSLLDYIFKEGGKVKNADFLKTYKHFINHTDQQLRAKYREDIKLVIDRIAVVKSENGEKYLVLKKKYKQLMQERVAKQATDSERPSQGQTSPPRQREWGETQRDPWGSGLKQDPGPPTSASTGKTEAKAAALVSWCGGPTITITEASDPEMGQQMQDEEQFVLPGLAESQDPEHKKPHMPRTTDSPISTYGEEQLDRDTGSKLESERDPEQEEEGTGSIGSNSVALYPLEKEWMHSAACGRLPHLSQLLKQDPSLAYKKDFTSTALHWAAKHGKGDMATLMANAGADVNIKAGYTPLHIAALHGHRHIMDLLVGTYGAKEDVRDYSGHLACQYLSTRDAPEEYTELGFRVTQGSERRNRKLVALFHPKSSGSSQKKWGSVEDLAPGGQERTIPHQLAIPAFRPRKFSR